MTILSVAGEASQRQALKSEILNYSRWYHSFRLDADTRIVGWAEKAGAYPPTAYQEGSFKYYHLPDQWNQKSVLDIGGWDGAIAFEMERRGSQEVVLVNPYTLDDMDFPLDGPGSRSEVEKKYRDNHYPLVDIHSGGARLMIQWLHSKVRVVDSGIYELPAKLTQPFDLVLCLGLLYHLRDPLRGLTAAASLTREMLILETMCFPGSDPLARKDRSYCEFLGGQMAHNWWRFNFRAVEGLLGASGFKRFERKAEWADRCVYHAFK
jgi:tRNA (mo5U34)-methyltransferase